MLCFSVVAVWAEHTAHMTPMTARMSVRFMVCSYITKEAALQADAPMNQRRSTQFRHLRWGDLASDSHAAIDDPYQTQEVVDITDRIAQVIAANGQAEGVCNLLVLHTTAALTTADLDP